MPIEVQDATPDVTKVILSGRIDIAGVRDIDAPLAAVSSTRAAIVIDLSGVEFMASMGLRSLVKCAKTVGGRRGHVVLLAPRAVVAEVIRASGISDLMPIYETEAEAIAALTAA